MGGGRGYFFGTFLGYRKQFFFVIYFLPVVVQGQGHFSFPYVVAGFSLGLTSEKDSKLLVDV